MRGNEDKQARRKFIQGQRAFSVNSKDKLMAARALFQEAVGIDDKFARAWGWLSYTYVQAWIYQYETDPGVLTTALEHAQRAVDLDPEDFSNHWDLAFAMLYSSEPKKIDRAVEQYKWAFKLTRDDTDALDFTKDVLMEGAEAMVYQGNKEEAVALMERTIRLPDWYNWNMAFAYFNVKRYDDALEHLQVWKWKYPPGHDRFVNHSFLLLAASHYMRNEENDRMVASIWMKMFRSHPQDRHWTCEKESAVIPFKHPEDEEHWIEALAGAGLPRT